MIEPALTTVADPREALRNGRVQAADLPGQAGAAALADAADTRRGGVDDAMYPTSPIPRRVSTR